MSIELSRKLGNLKLLALDFDGTLTDGFVYTDEEGKESVRTSRRDSLGMGALGEIGVKVIVISTEISGVVKKRCDKLGIESFSGVSGARKRQVLTEYMDKNNIFQSQVAYIGDDVNDIGCLSFVGVAITVADGHELCKLYANYITGANGGCHAVREVCDMILKAKGRGGS